MQIPYQWIEMAYEHEGIIAGGCLRDLILGKKPKDVDIFVSGLSQDDGHEDYIEGFKVQNINYGGTDYQIIKHRFTDQSFLEHFDLGICKVSYDPHFSGWFYSPEFIQDLANRTITVLRDDGWNFEDHLKRVSKKYPDFRVVPLKNADWNTILD